MARSKISKQEWIKQELQTNPIQPNDFNLMTSIEVFIMVDGHLEWKIYRKSITDLLEKPDRRNQKQAMVGMQLKETSLTLHLNQKIDTKKMNGLGQRIPKLCTAIEKEPNAVHVQDTFIVWVQYLFTWGSAWKRDRLVGWNVVLTLQTLREDLKWIPYFIGNQCN